MSREELKAVVDRCSSTERRFLLAYLRTKEPEYRRKLTNADAEISAGRSARIRVTRRGLVRIAKAVA